MNRVTTAGIRPLKPQDLERVVEIDEQIVGRPRCKFFEKRLAAALANGPGFVAVAWDDGDDGDDGDGELGGYAIARIQNGEYGADERTAVLDVIGVAGEARHDGAGQALLESICRTLGKLEIGELRTQVDWRNRELTRFFASAGFQLAPEQILERRRLEAETPDDDDPGNLSQDPVLVRSMRSDDLDGVIRIDAGLGGHDRRDYYTAKLKEVLSETGVRVSLVAEADDRAAGFIMARVDFGEFGRTEAGAIIDAIGVDPDHAHEGIASALLSQLLINLRGLRVERVSTRVGWNNLQLLGFLGSRGFAPGQQLSLFKTIAGG